MMTNDIHTNNLETCLRVNQVIQILPLGKSTWWAGVKSGRFPQPIKLGPRTTVWMESDIKAVLERAKKGEL